MKDKETKTIIENLKVNKLYKRVINEIVEDSKDYSGETLQERINARLDDIAHGLSSGIVGSYGLLQRHLQVFQEI